MEFLADTETLYLASEAKGNECRQNDPHCLKHFGEKCEKGCFEITIDLQDMSVVNDGA